MKKLKVSALALAACLSAFALPASAEWIGVYQSTEATKGALGQTWTGSWTEGWNRYEWFSDLSISGNVLSYDYLAGGASLGTPTQTYVFSTTAAAATELALGIDLSTNEAWTGSATALYIWQGTTDSRKLLSSGTNGAVEHVNASLNLAAGDAWGFMVVSGSIDDNNVKYTGPLWGSFTITDPATPSEVPEPGSLVLLGLGALGIAAVRRRKA